MDIKQIKKSLLEDKEFLRELSKKMNEDSFIDRLVKEASGKSPMPTN